ncbi:phosphoglycerate kinase [Candidatus Woesearchaeota archaeon]|nr:phosphoglycerate kinase [Candidatus Woesearchaeota archaeon]
MAKNLDDIDVKNKKVFLRTDFNAASRLKASITTIRYLASEGAKIIIGTHKGRPDHSNHEKYKLEKTASEISGMLGKQVMFNRNVIGKTSEKYVDSINLGEVMLLENLRFYSEERKGDRKFAECLSRLADVYINDAFSVSHRKDTSIYALPSLMKEQGKQTGTGYLLDKELRLWDDVSSFEGKKALVVGGAKLKEKMRAIKELGERFDNVVIGGVPYNVLRKVQGYGIGKSLAEEDNKDYAEETKQILDMPNIILGDDVYTSRKLDEELKEVYGKEWISRRMVDIRNKDIDDEYSIVDVLLSKKDKERLKDIKLAVMFGPLGIFEAGFKEGTEGLAKALSCNKDIRCIAGGGESAEAYKSVPNLEISTAGGAGIEYLIEGTLPGLDVLR